MTPSAGDDLRNELLGYWPGNCSPEGYLWDYSPESNHGIVGFDARWIWFTNPRAVRYVGRNDQTYFGYLGGPTGCDIQAGAYNHRTGDLTRIMLHESFSADDHTNPSLLIREDGHVLVFWTKHNGTDIYYATSTEPEDISDFGPRQTISQHIVTYPNPVQVTTEDQAPIYLFYRDREVTTDATSDRYGYIGDGHVYYRRSLDGGATWSDQFQMVTAPEGHYSMYFVHAQANDGTVHFFLTDAERGGDAPKWNVLHCAYHDGAFYRADGSKIADEMDLPMTRSDLETVYDSAAADNEYAWVWDAGVDPDGHPAVVYATFPSTLAHEYRYARWDGDEWHDYNVMSAGRYVEEEGVELHYSAGIAMAPSNPDTLYTCVHKDGYRGIKRLETATSGRTWAVQDITQQSTGKTLRPVVPLNASDEIPVLWLAGTYRNMQSSGTVLQGLPPNNADEGAIIGDGAQGVSLGTHRVRNQVFRDGVSVSALLRPESLADEGVVANFGELVQIGFGRNTTSSVEFTLSRGENEQFVHWDWSGVGNWHFVEGKWDGTEMHLLVDGKVVDVQSFEDPIGLDSEASDWTLLQDAYLMGNGFRGEMKEIRLYNRSLSMNESQQLAEVAQNPPKIRR
ncbi:Concanavalin A-like lectin/glucanases superfamily protein [Haladaptatus litoreus]|uniref:Concanavalin A-like lectin/glucanases superfamily protein n=1 Tax=Haladaptatus litoreus TaxID=553468 RepID=A0A1N7DFT2_9EURY|nr:BNR-4 repeat-containing protein [Haladaptatus litoreus]SIR74595.1 Concanavalin A-like lectin/glucanases superfamily protein [Haladaptatus litoreus]